MADDETETTVTETTDEVDYWAELPEKCKYSKRDRFNYIMNQINSQ